MSQTTDKILSFMDLLSSIKRHFFLGALIFVLITAMAVLAWLFLPREYGSEGRMVVRVGRANLGMNTTPEGAAMVSIQDTRETEIRSVMDLIQSQQVLGDVVDSIGAEKILANTIKLPEIPLLSQFKGSATGEMDQEEYERLRLREKAIKHMGKELSVQHQKKSANIAIYCTGPSPKLAQEIVDEIMRLVQTAHVKVHSANRSVSHFESGLSEKETALLERQLALEQFATSNNFLSVDDARGALNGVINKLKNDMVDSDLALRTSLAMVEELRRQSGTIDIEFEMPTEGMERLATAGAQGQYFERLGEKARLMAKYKPNHPQIVQINKEIDAMKKEVDALPEERVEKGMIRNPVHQELMVAMVKEIANAEARQQRITEIQAKLDKKHEELKNLNHLKTRASKLQRDVQLAQMEFDTYARKRNESRMVDQLDKEAISDIVVQQSASLVLKKVSPKGSLLLPLGAFLGMVFGAVACIFADRKNLTNLTTPEAVEEALGVPVMVSLPRVHSSRVMIN